MEKSKMVCIGCINFESGKCHMDPISLKITSPSKHFCSWGQWYETVEGKE